MPLKSTNQFVSIVILLIAAGLLVFYGITLFSNRTGSAENPYAYELDRNASVADAGYDLYTETEPVLFPNGPLSALCAGTQGDLFVAAGTAIFSVDSSRQIRLLVSTGDAVRCLAFNDGILYAGFMNKVVLYQENGTFVSVWDEFDETSILTSIAVQEDVYAADAGLRVVHRLSRSGKFLNRIGEKDPVRKVPGFIIPSPCFDVVSADDQTVWIVNPGRHTIENYTADGTLLRFWGTASMRLEGFSGCCNPTHLTMTRDGLFVTSEKGLERIKVYDNNGRLTGIVALPEAFEAGTRGLDLAVDRENRILVLDPVKMQVRIFQERGDS